MSVSGVGQPASQLSNFIVEKIPQVEAPDGTLVPVARPNDCVNNVEVWIADGKDRRNRLLAWGVIENVDYGAHGFERVGMAWIDPTNEEDRKAAQEIWKKPCCSCCCPCTIL